jgi:hypothetical protein
MMAILEAVSGERSWEARSLGEMRGRVEIVRGVNVDVDVEGVDIVGERRGAEREMGLDETAVRVR